MTTRNSLLSSIASAIGIVTDLSDQPRNAILKEISETYGAVISEDTQKAYLKNIDQNVNGVSADKTRNGYLKDIAEGLGATGLDESMSRNDLLNEWLLNAVLVGSAWILAAGTWGDSDFWNDSETWNDGV